MNARARSGIVQPGPSSATRTAILNRRCACAAPSATGEECRACHNDSPLRRAPASGRTMGGPRPAPSIVHEVLRTAGHPLDPVTRRFFEARFDHDFGRVRVHADARATASAAAVDALAYTVGSHVVVRADRYAASTASGRRLLAHELAHVVQQETARGRPGEPPVTVAPGGTREEREADAASTAVERHEPTPTVAPGPSGPRLARASIFESIARLFGGGTFSDDELLAYVHGLDVRDAIEDAYDSDNKARAIVAKWKAGDGRFFLTVRRKTLLIEEMISGFTGDDDEQAILALLQGSSDVELARILSDIGESRLAAEIHGEEREQFDALLSAYHGRRQQASAGTPGAAARAGGAIIERIVVNQEGTQSVTVHWSDGRQESDICSTGKGQCCVDPDQAGPAVTPEATRVSGSALTPVGEHRVALKLPVTPSGVRLWTEFVNARDIALHEYAPVDGTPLSHGCVRLNRPMAQTIFDGSVRGVTLVQIVGVPRPRCDYPMLQREWAGDFATAGTPPPDGERPEARRTRRHIARTRRQLRHALGASDPELTAEIDRLRRETGGLGTAIWTPEAREHTLGAVGPVAAVIPRCAAGLGPGLDGVEGP